MTENSRNECPTEILIDLKECDFIPYHAKYKKIQTPLDSQKSMKYLEENVLSETKQEKYQCIMDMSPLRLKKKCSDAFINSEQDSKGAVDDCPTAVLIEVPNSSSMHPKQYPSLNCNKNYCYQEDAVDKCKSILQGHTKQEHIFFGQKKCRVIEESSNPYDFNAMKNELSPPRPRWKTPSPQSMSRISSEASRIIHNLNTSAPLDEDSPLCEEILPLPINFDIDDNSDQENFTERTENSAAGRLSNHNSVSIETGEEAISPLSEKLSDTSSSSVTKNGSSFSEYQNSLAQSPSEYFKCQMNFKGKENSNECNSTSEEISSVESQSCLLGNYEIFASMKETDDVFIENNLSSEDKENILKRGEKEILPSNTLTRCRAAENISSSSKEMKDRKTLSNLSNVKYDIDARSSPYTKKINRIHYLKQNDKLNSKEFAYNGKQLLKKSTSEELRTIQKRISFGSSFQYGSSREAISSFQKPNSVKQTTSLLSKCKSSSSDVKNALTQMRTPSRRYSIATPLKSASTKKPAVSPALSRFQNPPVPRFMPQSAGNTCSSFSKSWQHPSVLDSKGSRYQNSVSNGASSAVIKPSVNRIYAPNTTKQAPNQRTSKLCVETSKNVSLSTSSKNRFSNKLCLPSPLLAGQERKLARALFPSRPRK